MSQRSLVCTQLNGLIALFDPEMGPHQVLPRQVRVDLGVMVMKKYSSLPQTPGLEPHHQMSYSLCRDAIAVFCSPSQLGCENLGLTTRRLSSSSNPILWIWSLQTTWKSVHLREREKVICYKTCILFYPSKQHLECVLKQKEKN